MYSRITVSPFFKVVVTQFIGTLLISGLCLAHGRVAAISALSAGLSCLIPTLYLLVVSLQPVKAGQTGLGHAVKGEIGKFALTIALLAVIFVFTESFVGKPLEVVAFFGTFILLQMSNAVVPLYEAVRLLRR